jgi:hypothetical protein
VFQKPPGSGLSVAVQASFSRGKIVTEFSPLTENLFPAEETGMPEEFLAICSEKYLGWYHLHIVTGCFIAEFPGINEFDLQLTGKVFPELIQDWCHLDARDTFISTDID